MGSSNNSRRTEMKRGLGVAALALACAGVTAATDADAQILQRFALRFEVGGGYMLSEYQRNDDPNLFRGNTKGFGTADFQASGRLAFQLFEPVAIQLSVANWIFPSTTGGGTGWVFAPMGGLHIEPRFGTLGRFFVDGNFGAAFTGADRRFCFDVGVGFEFQLTRAVALGPAIRYGHTIQPDFRSDGTEERFPEDARYITLGASLALRVPEREPEHTQPPVVPIDTDGDGVVDNDDLCPTVPAGDHPDPARRGCPIPDTDGDGVFDNDDQCVTVPAGDHPDPNRRGCPDVDTDNDGVRNQEDQCPTQPMGPFPDPNRRGCPESDNDHDGIVNSRDRCPDRPETFNNYQDTDGCPDRPPLVVLVGGTIRILGDPINFATNSDRIIGSRSFNILDALVSIMAAHAEIARIDIQGHTDNVGTPEYNLDLSVRRAATVRTYLIDHGIASERLESHGYGLTRPVADNGTARGRAANRRVEIHVLRLTDGTTPPQDSPTGAQSPAR